MAIAILLFLVFCFGVGIVIVLYFGATQVPGMLAQRKLEARLAEVSQPVESDGEPVKQIVKVQHEGPLPGLDRLLAGTPRGSGLARWIEQSGVKKASASGTILAGFGCAVAGSFVAAAVTRAPLAMPFGAALGFAVPFLVLKMKRTRRLRSFEEQFPEALDLIARALKAGHAFATGLKMAADELEEPVGPEFRKTFEEQNFGLPLKDALDNLTHRIPLLDVRFFATAVLIQRETGGNLAEILTKLAYVIRERFKILGQVQALTGEGRISGVVLMALPIVLFFVVYHLNPDYVMLLFTDQLGRKMIAVAAFLQVMGAVCIKKIVNIKV